MKYSGFSREGFEVIAAFDLCPELVDKGSTTIPIYDVADLEDYVSAHEVKMAIISVPGESAQTVANDIVAAGVQAILNFSPSVLQVPDHVVVNHVDLAVELENLSFFIS